jgi:integrase
MLSTKRAKKEIREINMNMNNKDYAREYVETRGLSETTLQKITLILEHYSTYQNKTIHELLQEADHEEDQGIRWKRRTLKTRLTQYMNYLKKEMLLSSAKTYLNTIHSFYLHHEIEIGTLPKWNLKNANIPEPITSKDMLTKHIIREALKTANNTLRPIILLEASSGMTRSDVLNLTIGQFIEATEPYHNTNNIPEAIEKMLTQDNIIPAFHLRRSKTNKYFITFCSPEATMEICKYLRLRNKRNKKYHRPLLTDVDKLFKIHKGTYIDKFNEINNSLNCGKSGTYNQFRGHMLRKFHATQLEKYGMSRALVNVLQGKSNNAVDDVYFLEDEQTLREEYIKALEGVLIYTDVKEITKYSIEYQKLEEENKKFREREEKLMEIFERLEKLENS